MSCGARAALPLACTVLGKEIRRPLFLAIGNADKTLATNQTTNRSIEYCG